MRSRKMRVSMPILNTDNKICFFFLWEQNPFNEIVLYLNRQYYNGDIENVIDFFASFCSEISFCYPLYGT